jgi:hypothetical protein
MSPTMERNLLCWPRGLNKICMSHFGSVATTTATMDPWGERARVTWLSEWLVHVAAASAGRFSLSLPLAALCVLYMYKSTCIHRLCHIWSRPTSPSHTHTHTQHPTRASIRLKCKRVLLGKYSPEYDTQTRTINNLYWGHKNDAFYAPKSSLQWLRHSKRGEFERISSAFVSWLLNLIPLV